MDHMISFGSSRAKTRSPNSIVVDLTWCGGAIFKTMCFVMTAVIVLVNTTSTNAIYARSNPGDEPAYCTLFNHMVKSGGSSIKALLYRASAIDGVSKPVTCIYGEAYEQACLDGMLTSPVIVGYTEILRQSLQRQGRDCEYFTVMRHPIDRLVSAFFYCPDDHDIQHRPRKWCGHLYDPTPVIERLVGFMKNAWGNMALRQLSAGIYCSSGPFCSNTQPKNPPLVTEPGGMQLLEQLQEILATYEAIGIMEHWEISMDLFDAKVKSPVHKWHQDKHMNKGRESVFRNNVYLHAHTSLEIRNYLATDLLLYDYALSLFKAQTNATLGTVWW